MASISLISYTPCIGNRNSSTNINVRGMEIVLLSLKTFTSKHFSII